MYTPSESLLMQHESVMARPLDEPFTASDARTRKRRASNSTCKIAVIFIVLIVIIIGLVIALTVVATGKRNTESKGSFHPSSGNFSLWNSSSSALRTLVSYVNDVTNPYSKNFIPVADRIATFDFDGTLFGEKHPIYIEWYMFVYRVKYDPTYTPTDEMRTLARDILDALTTYSPLGPLELKHAELNAQAFAGMTMDEFSNYTREFLTVSAPGFYGMSIGEAYYLPMCQVVKYLIENNFKVYICSGTDRFLLRELVGDLLPFPLEQVLGSTYGLKATHQGDTDGAKYYYTTEDDVLRTGTVPIKNIKMNKVDLIAHEIGRAPVLSFGNTHSDFSMNMYATSKNKYKSLAYILLADDLKREYGNLTWANELRAEVVANGWVPVSMRDDFVTIYGNNVKITACPSSQTRIECIKDRNVLLVATTGDSQPLAFLNKTTRTYSGLEIEIAQSIADQLGVPIHFVPTTWDDLSLDVGRNPQMFDFAIGDITITDDRTATMAMSSGYIKTGKTILCRRADASKYTSLASLNKANVRVMVDSGSLNEEFVRTNLPEATMLTWKAAEDIPDKISANAADVMITDLPIASYYASTDSNLAAPLLSEPFTTGYAGILMRQGQTDLMNKINNILQQMKKDGTLRSLHQKYGLPYSDN